MFNFQICIFVIHIISFSFYLSHVTFDYCNREIIFVLDMRNTFKNILTKKFAFQYQMWDSLLKLSKSSILDALNIMYPYSDLLKLNQPGFFMDKNLIKNATQIINQKQNNLFFGYFQKLNLYYHNMLALWHFRSHKELLALERSLKLKNYL